MKPIHYDDFKKALIECHAAHGRDAPPDGKVRAAFKALAKYSLDEVKRACQIASDMDLQYAPWAGKIAGIIKKQRENIGPGLDENRSRCCFTSNGQQCPLRGHHPIDPQNPSGPRECDEHHSAKNDAEKAQILDDLIRNRPLPVPEWRDALMAQNMLKTQPDDEVTRVVGRKVVAFVRKHQAEYPDILDFYRQSDTGRQQQTQSPNPKQHSATSVAEQLARALPGATA